MKGKLFEKSSLVRTDEEDPRGPTFKAELDGKEYAFLYMRKGALRGGHYHELETFHLVIQGKIRFELIDPSTLEQSEVVARPMDIIRISAGIAHLLEAKEDSMFIEPLSRGRIIDFEPQRVRVRKFLQFDMAHQSPSQEERISWQYREVYACLRHHDILLWQLPTTASAINGALIVASFHLLKGLIEREATLFVATILTLALAYASIKHRYFSGIEQETLSAIEDNLGIKRIQRTSEPEENIAYWQPKLPGSWRKRSAHEFLIAIMFLIAAIDIILMVYLPYAFAIDPL